MYQEGELGNKSNCVVVKDYFEKVKSVTAEYGFMEKLENF
jgi:hypothetical protein